MIERSEMILSQTRKGPLARLFCGRESTCGAQSGGPPEGVGHSEADQEGPKMTYMSEEERRRRIIELVRKKRGVACPTLYPVGVEIATHEVTLFYWCTEGDVGKNELEKRLVLTNEEAEYIGVSSPAYEDTQKCTDSNAARGGAAAIQDYA